MAGKKRRKWLPFGWKVMAAYGLINIFFAIIVPFSSYFGLPGQPMFVFAQGDAQFTGLTWGQIAALSPDLGTWIVLTMASMCAMMMGVGILTFMIARHAYRNGERWAWKALVAANVLTLAYYVFFIGGVHAAKGLPFWTWVPGTSGVGADLFVVIFAVWLAVGLWLPRKELQG
ncbi:MAG: hypothetical protein HY519_03175 [Candidatus Aenigmarchaeota archaeon]|nr:hypothetical protein [Candidatus Aenigmarchaeota archaeon]